MYQRLFIAEKPSLAQAIAAHLPGARAVRREGFIEVGDDAVTWCFGHLLEQAPPEAYGEQFKRWRLEDLPVVPQRWKLLPKEDARKQLKVIGELLGRARQVVNAGDPDREGELLVREVLEHHRYAKPTLRLWLSALDEASVRKALAALAPGARYDGMYEAALARARADWLVGMNCTRAMTVRNQAAGGAGVLSVGRVQTPTLALVVKRDLDIERFVSREYFELVAQLAHARGTFRAKWKPAEGAPTDEESRVLERAPVQAAAERVHGRDGRVTEYTAQARKEPPPLPFSLSTLQAACSARFGLGAQKVLDIAQALYEKHKLTSYPRTDSQHLPESQHAEAPDVLAALAATDPTLAAAVAAAQPTLRSAAWNDKKVSAHHGIIPTRQRGSVAALTGDERRVYGLICRSYLAQFYPECTFTALTVRAEVAGEQFVAHGKVPQRAGWRVLFAREAAGQATEREAEREAEEPEQTLPEMARGEALRCTDAQVLGRQTKPPARFTEGTLIRAMANAHQFVEDPAVKKVLKENAGIGTEATRAAILETLKRREFLLTRGKHIVSTDKGRAFIETARGFCAEVVSPELTALFEQKLSAIEQRENTVAAFLAEQADFVTAVVARIRSATVTAVGVPAAPTAAPGAQTCPACGREGFFRRVKGPRGYFWGCAGWRDASCRFTVADKRGKPDTEALARARKGAGAGPAAEAPTHRCPACAEGWLRRTARKDRSGYFWGCSRWRDGCKYTARDQDGEPVLVAAQR
jgi:DNA topoisomerase-3